MSPEPTHEEAGAPGAADAADAVDAAVIAAGRAAPAAEAADGAAPAAEPRDDDRGVVFPAYAEHDVAAAQAEGCADAGLADFQEEAVAALAAHFERHAARAGLLCLPTGGGKTRTALEWLLRRQVAEGRRVLWITHRVDLLDQVHAELLKLRWLLAGRRERIAISRYDGEREDLRGDVVLASAMSLASRKPGPADLAAAGRPVSVICFDEAHRAVAPETLKTLKALLGDGVQLLGLTATPFRSSDEGTRAIQDLFGERPVYQRTFQDLVRVGFLARPCFIRHHLRATEQLELGADELRAITRQRDLTPDLLARLARDPERNREIVEHWSGIAPVYGKTLVFACTIAHAEELAARFRAQGHGAEALHSGLDDDVRRERLARFRDGRDPVLVNVGILTEGANIPDTRTVVMARPTLSTVLYLQMIGRGARGPRTVPGKDRFYILDCVDNFQRHGLTLAGQGVARELGSELYDELPVVRPAARADVQREIERRRAGALGTATAWLLLRGLEPQQYSFWGELAWQRAGGARKSVAVFAEGVGVLGPAVALVRDALATGQWNAAEDQGVLLDRVGAVRAVDWMDLIADCKVTRQSPLLLGVPELAATDADLAAGRRLAELVGLALDRGIAAAERLCGGEWQASAALRAGFLDAAALRAEVARMYDQVSTQGRAPAPPPLRWDTVEAFVALALAVARADGDVAEAEVRTAARGAQQVFGLRTGADRGRLEGLLAGHPTADLQATAQELRARLTWPALLATLDVLVQVAVADGRFTESERLRLDAITRALGLPADELRARCDWYGRVDPRTPATVAPGVRACAVCATAWGGDARFCTTCGAALGSAASADG